jgi:hypothetical protein
MKSAPEEHWEKVLRESPKPDNPPHLPPALPQMQTSQAAKASLLKIRLHHHAGFLQSAHACALDSQPLAEPEPETMQNSDQIQPEPQVFVLKQGQQESDAAFEERIGSITQKISESAPEGPVILYSVAQPTNSAPAALS